MKLLPLKSAMILLTRNRISNRMTNKCLIRGLSTITELTRIRYPDVKRGDFAQIENDDLVAFREILDNNRVITEESDLEGKSSHIIHPDIKHGGENIPDVKSSLICVNDD